MMRTISQQSRMLWLPVVLSAAVLLYLFAPDASGMYPPCPLHAATGWYCPGCGSLRALHHLLHGRLPTAFSFNPILVVLLPLLLWHGLYRMSLIDRPSPFEARGAARWVLLIVLAYWLLRNMPWPPFSWLAPGGLLTN